MTKNRFEWTISIALSTLIFFAATVPGEERRSDSVESENNAKVTPSPLSDKNKEALKPPVYRSFNVRSTAGLEIALEKHGDKGKDVVLGGQGAIGMDWRVSSHMAFSLLVANSALHGDGRGTLNAFFAAMGLRYRHLFTSGQLFLEGHVGYCRYDAENFFGYHLGLGYGFALAPDFYLGPYFRFARIPSKESHSPMFLSFGVEVSLGVAFESADTDKDSVQDRMDRCPAVAEDIDKFEDDDGCPDNDNDQDKIPDDRDHCPNTAGVLENAGCESKDDDHDGILNDNDKCKDEPEDKDGFEDEEGCPDPDNDQDGLPDDQDQCPMFPEREDGCPDFILLGESEIKLLRPVVFVMNNAAVDELSQAMLREVVVFLKLNPEISLSIEAHTDNLGDKEKNQEISTVQAEAVKAILEAGGIDEQRLFSEGMGSDKPLESDTTPSGQEKNNRIELRIIRVPNLNPNSP